jgi:hypothetical protein
MYDFRFYQACMGQTQLISKVGWGYSGVYRGKFRESKVVNVYFIMGFHLV